MSKQRLLKKDTKEYQFFISAVINDEWKKADDLYPTIPDQDFLSASQVVHSLVKQFKNDALERVLQDYRSLDINVINYKGLAPIHVAFNNANRTAARLLRQAGANVLITDAYHHDIVYYAKWSRCKKTIDLSKTMMVRGMAGSPVYSPPPPQTAENATPVGSGKKNFSELADKLMEKRRRVGDTIHYMPDFSE